VEVALLEFAVAVEVALLELAVALCELEFDELLLDELPPQAARASAASSAASAEVSLSPTAATVA
jgi:hypothetical protein